MKTKLKWLLLVALLLPTWSAMAATYYGKATVKPDHTDWGMVYLTNGSVTESGLTKFDGTTQYQTTNMTVTGSASVLLASSATVSLYAYARPNFGWAFKNWTKGNTDAGSISSQYTRSTTISGSCSSKSPTSPTNLGTFTANFTNVTPVVVASHVGDEVTLHFYNSTSGGSYWLTLMDGHNVTGTSVVNAQYGSIKRSTDNKTNHFSLTLKATNASNPGEEHRAQLSVIDDNGNNYCFYLVMLPPRFCCLDEPDIGIELPNFTSKSWATTGPQSLESSVVEVTRLDPASPSAGNTHTNILVKGKSVGKTTVTAQNCDSSQTTTGMMGAVCQFAVNVYNPLDVDLCEGDYVKGGFKASENKNWSMYVGNEHYDISPTGTGDVIVATSKVRVRLAAVNPATNATLQVWALAADDSNSDYTHISVTDGSEWYGMHVHVDPARVIPTGASVTNNLASFADHAMNIYNPSSNYVAVAVDNTNPRLAKATMTGLAPTDYAWMQIYEADYTGATGPQALGYVLAMSVVGARTIPAMISAGSSIEVLEGLNDVAADATYTVEAEPANAGVTVTAVAAGADRARVTLATDASATLMSTVTNVVKVGDDAKVKYNVTVYPTMAMSVGQVAPGCLLGCATPWTVWTSDATGLKGEPVLYGQLNSGRIEALKVGDYSVWATNSTTSVGYYAIRAKVHDVANTSFCLEKGTSTNLVVKSEYGWEALWSVTGGVANVTATLDNTSSTTATSNATVTVAAADAANGTCSFTVMNDYHYEYVNVYVGDESVAGKQLVWTKNQVTQVNLPGVGDPEAQILPNFNFDGAWTATSENPSIVTLSTSDGSGAGTSGGRDDRVWVKPVAAGSTRVVVSTDTTVYIYEVKVVYEAQTVAQVVVGKNESKTLTSPVAGSTAASASAVDKMIVDVEIVDNGAGLKLTGLQDGETTVEVEDLDGHVYKVPVRVHSRSIDKTVNLVIGKTTSSSYTYTFDSVISINNQTPGYVSVSRDGNAVTFTPTVPGNAHVSVVALVDGLNESTTLNYTFNITQLSDTSLEVLNYGDGYITYKGAAEVKPVDNDYVLIFTNTAKNGMINIPDELTANLDILAVGGGGSGGSSTSFGKSGGGGGAGGFAYSTDKKLTKGSFSVVVGAGADVYSDVVGDGATPGNRGGDSVITNAFGYALTMAYGGGGGGAPSNGENAGRDGGSGGGGAFYSRNAGTGGHGESGQGTTGGTPNDYLRSGGGGGAGGNGGAGGAGGQGKSSSITGTTVVYSAGGEGGYNDDVKAAAAGTNPGDGGDGGSGGAGGSGADGVVIVRLKQLYKNIQVPIPTTNDLITARFLWSDGTNCAPFKCAGRTFRSTSNQHPYNWDDVIDHIDGTTNIVCTLDGTNKVGVGYYNFKVYLKSGYSWASTDNPEYGLVQGMSYRWVVVEDWANIDASIAVNKTVWWTSTSNATVRVNSISSPEMSGGGTPNVLFLGTLCKSHNLVVDTVVNSLKAIASKANVEYYLFGNNAVSKSGTLEVGGTISSTDIPALASSQHSGLQGFYSKLDELLITGEKKYDYIVFEFDGSRIAKSYGSGGSYPVYSREAEVSAVLKTYYADNRIIWIVDGTEDDTSNSSVTVGGKEQDEPFGEGADEYWRPNTYYFSVSGNTAHQVLNVTEFRGLVGMFDPDHYVTNATTYAQLATTNITCITGTFTTNRTYWGSSRIEHQARYDNPAAVVDMLNRAIKARPYNLYYQDRIISPAKGLTIQGVTIEACTNGVNGVASTNANDWVEIIEWEPSAGGTGAGTVTYLDTTQRSGIKGASMAVDLTTNLVTAVLSNIDFQVWVRYDTEVLDDGTFCTSEDATYNQSTGQYEKNPNDGVAYISMVDDLGRGIGVDGDADTAVPWRYVAYQVRGHVVGNVGGEIYVGGTQKTTLSYAEGYNVPVYYRGRGGYKLVSLKVDDTELPVTGDNVYFYQFTNLQADHDVYVTYESYYGDEASHPVTNVYNGATYVVPVDLIGWDPDYPTEIRYAISPDAPEGEWKTEQDFITYYSKGGDGEDAGLMDVGDHTVYYRIYAQQPGYPTLKERGYVWVDTGTQGSNVVTITPRPLVITANSFKLESDSQQPPYTGPWQGVTVRSGDLVGDDTVDMDELVLSCPTYQAKLGQYKIELHNAAGSDHDHDDVTENVDPDSGYVRGNYIVYLNPGVLSVIKSPIHIDGVAQHSDLDPEDPYADTGVDRVEVPYDGNSYGLTVTITSTDLDEGGFRILYSTDDGQTWSPNRPTFYHAGTNKVWYAVESAPTYDKSSYFWATNYNYVIIQPREITVTAATSTKQYDGTALTNPNYTYDATLLASGDVLTSSTSGSQLNVGTSANALGAVAIANTGDDRTGDYTITKIGGTLTVTPAFIKIGNVVHDPDNKPEYGQTGIDEVEKYYDGIATNITVNVTLPTEGATIYYRTSKGGEWTTTNPTFTEAGSHTVYVKVEAENYATIETYSRVWIKPRPLTVTVQDAQMRQGDSTLPAFSAVVTDDLKSQEKGSAVVVDPSVANSLSYTIGLGCDHKNLAPENLPVTEAGQGHELDATGETVQVNGNYTITYVPGTLTVTEKQPIPYTVESPNVVYGGTNICITVTPGAGAPAGTTVMYGPDPDHLIYSTREAAMEAQTGLGLNEVSESGTLVYFSVTSSDPDYVGVTNSAPVYIQPRPIVIKANDAEKYYSEADPTPFTASVLSGTGANDGLVSGESPAFVYTVTRTPNAEEVATYTGSLVPSGEARQGNYSITYQPGTFVIYPWYYPVGPNRELIPVDEVWIGTNGPNASVTNSYHNASNYVFGVGANGTTNWQSYVLGLTPGNLNSVIYLDIEQNPTNVELPTLIARGAKIHSPLPLGSLEAVNFHLIDSQEARIKYGPVEGTTDNPQGRFPLTQSIDTNTFYRVKTLFQFNPDWVRPPPAEYQAK